MSLQQSTKACSGNFVLFIIPIIIFSMFYTHVSMALDEAKTEPAWKRLEQAVVYGSAYQLDSVEKADPFLEHAFTVRLKDLGYRKGITFEGAETTHEARIDFSLPVDTKIEDAHLLLKYRVSPLLNKLANLQVSIGSYALEQVNLNTNGVDQALMVEIPKQFLQGENLQLIIRASLPVTDDRCLDDRLNASNLHITENSSFTLHYSGEIGSIRDAWTLLPSEVILSLPNREFSPAEFNAAWELLDTLRRQGKAVEVVTFPKIGHIVISKREELEKLLQQELDEQQPSTGSQFSIGNIEPSTLALIKSPVRSLIAVLDPQETGAFGLLNSPWRKLGLADRYRTYPVDYADNLSGLGSVPPKENALEIKLGDLNIDTSTRFVRSSIKWNMILDPFRLPPGTRPNRMFLNIIAPPPPGKPPFEFYVYLNDIMVHAATLENGKKQEIAIPLPQKYQEPYNRIQVQVLNIDPMGECKEDLTAFPVQILPDSSLIVERDLKTPKNFTDLPVYFADNFDVYLPAEYLQTPVESLPYVSEVTARLPVAFKTRVAEIVQKGEVVKPTRPFIAFGNLTFESLESPVKFDKGEIEVVDRDKSPLFKVDNLPGITIAQIVKSQQQYGLWLRPAEENAFPDISKLYLNHDDVAFADRTGLLFSLNSKQPTLATVYYPEARDWFALLGKYRFWLFAIGWIALTLIVLYLFRRAKQHRENLGNY